MNKIKLLICCLLLSISLVGCVKNDSDGVVYNRNHNRFLTIYLGGGDSIYVDKETGVQYLFVKSGYGAGMTVIVDADGKPLLYEGEVE